MKKGLLGSTALIAATAFTVGAAQAAEAPTYKMSGYLTFLAFFVSQDGTGDGTSFTTVTTSQDDATMFLEVNEAEYHISASGATDNGLTYGLTMQLNAVANESSFSDEVYGNIGGSWGKLEFGSNDGAEDSFAVGAESIMGGVGGFDGEYFDVVTGTPSAAGGKGAGLSGDTGDANKLTYYSPDFSGFKLGVSYTPNTGDDGRISGDDSDKIDSIGVGAQYSGNVGGGVSLKLGAVYVTDSNDNASATEEDSAWSVGGIVGFQNFQVAASYADNGDSSQTIGSGIESSYWNVGASFEQGPMYLSAGYHVYTVDLGAPGEDELSVISLTADYAMAPGLSVLAEVNLSSDEPAVGLSNDATTVILGTKVSF